MAFPIIAAGLGAITTVPALVATEVIDNAVSVIENVTDVFHHSFDENYKTRRLALEISKNYTTSLKDINGSIIIDQGQYGRERLEQIERLIQATLNQNKFR